jgi:succinate dehydrogenase/fumarate reductase flavoprotein subunit
LFGISGVERVGARGAGIERVSRDCNFSSRDENKSMEMQPIPPEVMAELQEAAEDAAKGIRDPERMRKACERMDRMREEIEREFGVQDIGVQIIREMRDGRNA